MAGVGQGNIISGIVSPTTFGPWTQFTMTITGSVSNPTKGTTTTDNAYYRQVGSGLEIYYSYAAGTGSAGSGVYLFAIPSGYTINNTVIVPSPSQNYGACGSCCVGIAADNYIGTVRAYNTTNLSLECANGTGVTGIVGSSFAPLSDTEPVYSFHAIIPL